jgi:hypothetical protein
MDHLALVSAAGQPDIRASQQSDGSIASSAQLHKQLLAAEVAKLRKELATLKAQEQQSAGGGLVGVSEALKMVSNPPVPVALPATSPREHAVC